MAMEWNPIEGRLKSVSINLGGLWGLSENGEVFFRTGTFENYQRAGTGWWEVEGKLQQLSVGWNAVWAVDHMGQVWYRDGMDIEHHSGTKWTIVPTPGPFKQVSVDRLGHVWALDQRNEIYMRVGACVEQIAGLFWRKVGSRRMAQLDVGKCGVWAVDENKQVFYKQGTYGENGKEGGDWEPVGHGSILLQQVSTGGDDMLVGLTSRGELYMRADMGPSCPTGASWRRLSGDLRLIDVYGYTVWGIDSASRPVTCKTFPSNAPPKRPLRDTFF